MSNHSVDSQVDCSLKCLEEQFCVGYNYRSISKKVEINCQTSRNTSLERDTKNVVQGEWMFYEHIENLLVSIYSLLQHRERNNGLSWYTVTPCYLSYTRLYLEETSYLYVTKQAPKYI